MNALIPMSGNVPDLAAAYTSGMQSRAYQQEQENQNALRQALQQYGAAASQGDQQALAQLAKFDPKLASGLQNDQMSRQQTQHGMADDDARLSIARDQARATMEEHSARMDEGQRQKAAEHLDLVAGAAQAIGSAEEWDRYFGQDKSTKDMVGHFGDRDIIIAQAQGGKDALGGSVPADIQEYEYGQKDPGFNQWQEGRRNSAKAYGSLYYSKGDDGQIHAFQTSSDGTPKEVQLPDGQQVLPPTRNVDQGTFNQVQTVAGGVPLTNTPIDLAGKAQLQAQGQGVGQTIAGAQSAVGNAQIMFDDLDANVSDLLSHPDAIKSVTGSTPQEGFGGVMPSITSDDRSTRAKLAQLSGQSFLGARTALKGGGAITDYEGQKAEQALSRLQQAQGAADFTQALEDFRDHMKRGLDLLRQQSQGNVTGQAPQPDVPPEVMSVLKDSRPGTRIKGPDGTILVWDGSKLIPAQ